MKFYYIRHSVALIVVFFFFLFFLVGYLRLYLSNTTPWQTFVTHEITQSTHGIPHFSAFPFVLIFFSSSLSYVCVEIVKYFIREKVTATIAVINEAVYLRTVFTP